MEAEGGQRGAREEGAAAPPLISITAQWPADVDMGFAGPR